MRSIAGLSRQVLLEARRDGLPPVALATLCIGVLLGWFLSRVALTEGRELQAAAAAAILRASSIFLIVSHAVVSVAREYQDKGMELHLAQPISRSTYYLGRLAGHACVAAVFAILFSLPLFMWAPAIAVVLWGISLLVENVLAVCAALFFAVSFARALPATAATLALYLLGRSIDAIHAIAAGPLNEDSALGGPLVGALSYLLPRLDLVTRTDWLLYGLPGWQAYLAPLAGLACYALLLVAAGLFDLYRRNL